MNEAGKHSLGLMDDNRFEDPNGVEGGALGPKYRVFPLTPILAHAIP